MAVNPGRTAQRPGFVPGTVRPPNPKTGGHYVPVAGGHQLIHAVGPGKWAPGPPKPAAPAATKPAASAANRFNNPLYQPSQVLSGKPLYQATTALTNRQYDPLIGSYQQQLNQNTLQGAGAEKATAGYFNTLGQYAQQSADRVNAIGQSLNTTLANIGQGTQSALTQYAQQAVAPGLQTLAAQGLGGGATEALAGEIARQQGLAATRSQAAQDYGAQAGSAASTLAAQNLGTYALRGQERLGNIGMATRLAAQPVQEKLATTRAEKANAFATNLMAARAAERNYGIAQAGLGLKQAAITSASQTAAANRQAENQRTQQTITGENQRTQANIDARAVQGNLDRQSRQQIAAQNNATRTAISSGTAAAKAGKPASPAAQRVIWNQISGTQGRVRQLTSWLESWGASSANARSQAWHALNTGRLFAPYKDKNGDRKWHWVKIPPVGDTGLLNAAYNSLGGGLSPGDVSYLHNMGFTIGGRMPIRTDVSRAAGNVGQTVAQGVGRFKF